MDFPYKHYRTLPTKQLKAEIDSLRSFRAEIGIFLLGELHNRTLLRYTCWIVFMTSIVTIATVVNLCLTFKLLH
jgi:hypothetical protein